MNRTWRIGWKKWTALAALAAGGAVTYLICFRGERMDSRFNGAYLLADSSLVIITPREEDVLRYRMMSGESAALWPVGERAYEAGPGWSERQPVVRTVRFSLGPDGRPDGFTWQRPGGPEERARRVDLPERMFFFRSGELTLRGKLITPRGEGPFPAVIVIHGSGEESAVDTYFDPYLHASHGIATLVYDKRGTGESEGRYTQNFVVLARDAAAAVNWLRSRPEIDPERIHLAGYSQGGWIAPLAATMAGGIRSLLIGYGAMVPVTDEDRWGYVYALRRKGFGEDSILEVDRLDEVVGAIIDRGEDRWEDLARQLDEARSKPWFETVKGSDSVLGFITAGRAPLWLLRIYAWWKLRPTGNEPFVDRLYDPVPTMASLAVPSLWILGGEDDSMPTEWTLRKLETLKSAGCPIEVIVYPRADHGILRFEDDDAGNRRYLAYESSYFATQVSWLRRQSGLE